MIKIENTQVVGWEPTIRGMRNPLNSWDKSDTNKSCSEPKIGPNDLSLMMKLSSGGSVHAKYRRYIDVYVDITAPLYFWKEFDTYRTVVSPNPFDIEMNSCSTMHKIHAKPFTPEDFSMEHLIMFDPDDPQINLEDKEVKDEYCSLHIPGSGIVFSPEGVMELTINMLNRARFLYLKTKDKKYWWQLIQLLPTNYNQLRTLKFNYEVLSAMYFDRRNHKLDEWHGVCDWIESLPYSEIMTNKKEINL